MIPLMLEKGYQPRGWLGLILGTRLYYPFYDLNNEDQRFEQTVDRVVREIGDRGKHTRPVSAPEALLPPPKPAAAAMVLAPTAAANPGTPQHAAASPQGFTPSMQQLMESSPAMPMAPFQGGGGSFSEMACFFEKQQAALLEREEQHQMVVRELNAEIQALREALHRGEVRPSWPRSWANCKLL